MITDQYYNVPACNSFREYMDRLETFVPSRIAFKTEKTDWTYREFTSAVRRAADALSEYRKGIFALDIEDPYLFAVLFFAVVLTGGVAALLPGSDHSLAEPSTKKHIIDDAEAAALIRCGAAGALPETDPALPCVIVKSSGTTSVCKDIMLSQKNLLSDMIGVLRISLFKPCARYVKVLPYNHLFGLMSDLLLALYSGGTVCFCERSISWMKSLAFFQPTQLHIPPAAVGSLHALLSCTDDYQKTTGGLLRKIICGGAPLDEENIPLFRENGCAVYNAYGLSECSPCVSINGENALKSTSVGRVIPCSSVKIVDGEIAVRGDNVMLGYYMDEAATQAVLRDGWLYTGDLGRLDGDGFLYLTGRRTNLIVLKNGIKIVPEAIERELAGLPEIVEARVSASPDRDGLDAVVVVRDGAVFSGIRRKAEECLRDNTRGDLTVSVRQAGGPLARNALGKLIRSETVSRD